MGKRPEVPAAKSAALRLVSAGRCGVILAVFAIGMLSSGCSRSDTVATYSGGEVTRAQYEGYLQFAEVLDHPSAIKEMILIEHLSKEASAKGLDDGPEVKVELVTEEQRIFGEKLRNHTFLNAEVSEEEIKRLADGNPAAFQKPRKLRLRQVYMAAKGDPDRVRERLEDVRAAALSGESFEELALRESESQTRFSGGNLGFLDPQTLPEPVAGAVAGLAEGELSEVVPIGNGFAVYLCEKVKEAVNPTREEVEAKIRKNLLRQRGKNDWHNLVESLRAQVVFEFPLVLEDGVYQLHEHTITPEELEALKALQMRTKGWDSMAPGHVHGVLQNWCLGRLIAGKARELGLDQDPETANKLNWNRRSVLAYRLLDQRVKARLQPPDEGEIEAFYQAHKDRIVAPPEFRVAAILFGAGGNATEKARKVNHKIESGEITFAEAARRYSRHQSASNGGLWDWMLLRELAEWGIPLSKAVRQIQAGERTGVFRLDSGIWIFELVDVKESRRLTLQEASGRILNNLNRKAVETVGKALRSEILEQLDVKIPMDSEGS